MSILFYRFNKVKRTFAALKHAYSIENMYPKYSFYKFSFTVQDCGEEEEEEEGEEIQISTLRTGLITKATMDVTKLTLTTKMPTTDIEEIVGTQM